MALITDQSLNPSTKNRQIAAIGAVLTTILAVLPLPVQALTFVTKRTDLGGNDQVDWSNVSKIFNPFAPDPAAFLPNSFSVESSVGQEVNVNIPLSNSPNITPPFVFQTSFPPNGIPTNFALGDFLLYTGAASGSFPAIGNPGPLTITFPQGVTAAGTQIAVDDTPEFTAFVSAFDTDNNLLGTFSIPATSSLTLDNSAVFLGVKSDIPNIKRLVFNSSEPNRAIAINTLSITTVFEATPTFGLLCTAILGMGLFRKVRVE
jgi:hypothetical protein